MSIRIADWSTTPISNTSVDGVNIQENCPYANLNNMGRAIMSAVKYEVAGFGANVAAAATPDIGSVGGALTITGVTTITGFATAPSGLLRTLHFETATPVAAGASLALPGGLTSINFVKGGVAKVRSLGSAAWKMEWFDRGDGKAPVSSTIGKHKIPLSATAWSAHPVNTPAFASVTEGSIVYDCWDFDQTLYEAIYTTISLPSSWNEGTITFVPRWTAASGSGNVEWALYAVARGNDDAITGSYSANVTSTDALIATGDLHRGPESSALTIDGSPAANDEIFLIFQRNGGNAGDTLNADARLLGVDIFITTDAAVDAA